MKILVLNCGSSSIKYQLLDMPTAEVLAKGLVERIGESEGKLVHKANGRSISLTDPIADHGVGLKKVIALLTQGEDAALQDLSEIGAVGHRVVHGGEQFAGTVVIDHAVMSALDANTSLAPLHNPPNILGIKVAQDLLPGVMQVGVFDTAFHQTMPPVAYLYALPRSLYEEDGVRRYGFHGTSHRYVAARAADFLGKRLDEINLITCHLGNGSSVAAIKNGKSIDTTMGMTPLEGLIMGTRSGDIDPAIIFHLVRQKGMTVDQVDKLLNKQSGLIALSGTSNNMLVLENQEADGDERSKLAIDAFCYRLKKYIGAYSAVLGRVDAVVFTAGIGENGPIERERTCVGLENLGIYFDIDRNNLAPRGHEVEISADASPVKVLVIPTNEEKLIAQDTFELASR